MKTHSKIITISKVVTPVPVATTGVVDSALVVGVGVDVIGVTVITPFVPVESAVGVGEDLLFVV